MAIDITGPWHNQHHSILHLVQTGDTLSGRFVPGVGIHKGEAFPLTGRVSGDQIAFFVPFGAEGSISAWTGHVRRDASGDQLDTLWNMTVRVGAKEPDGAWRGIWSGADTFARGEPALVRVGSQLPSVPIMLFQDV